MNGGPAFPVSGLDQRHGQLFQAVNATGMTLRDYFAAKAMLIGGPANQPPAYDNETRAKYAYEMADAMLEARK